MSKPTVENRDEADAEKHWHRLIVGLRAGDAQIIREFCDRYGNLMEALAEKHLAPGLARRVGPDDIVQSACRTFLRRAKGGEFQLNDSADLWRLLCAITLTKVREQARFHLRKKRGVAMEVQQPSEGDGSSASGGFSDFFGAAAGPSPADAAAFADQFAELLAQLNEEERQLVQLKLEDCTNDQAAERMGCSERTVRRILKNVQARLAQVFEISLSR